VTNFILRIKKQETRLTLHEHDDDDDDDDDDDEINVASVHSKQAYVTASSRNVQRSTLFGFRKMVGEGGNFLTS